ncbi:hypothetical protein BKA56DRAFT_180823 [Ilyonectria sp. MPI-CAGE-AT-0026]|nr:hypothetical protein BKA56DRAFT_180823 [Ilyonectria sp. MPI-CAGE-AT-0026]
MRGRLVRLIGCLVCVTLIPLLCRNTSPSLPSQSHRSIIFHFTLEMAIAFTHRFGSLLCESFKHPFHSVWFSSVYLSSSKNLLHAHILALLLQRPPTDKKKNQILEKQTIIKPKRSIPNAIPASRHPGSLSRDG